MARTGFRSRVRKASPEGRERKIARLHDVAHSPSQRLEEQSELAARREASSERPLSPGAVLAMQSTVGNQAVSRRLAQDGAIQRKEVTVGTETVEVHSVLGSLTKRGKAEQLEAEAIIKALNDTYGVDPSSSKLVEAIKAQYTNVPAKVTKALKARKWRMIELRALADALKHYAPILGKARATSSRSGEAQEVVAVGKGAQAIDTNKPAGKLDTTTLGEYFKGKKVMGLFKASEGHHDEFPDEKTELVATFVHEIAHGVLAYAYDEYVASGSGGFWTDQNTKSGAKGAEAPPTTYGKKNAREDMCDTASLFFITPDKLSGSPKRLAFMQKIGKDWIPPLKEAPVNLGGGDAETPVTPDSVPVPVIA